LARLGIGRRFGRLEIRAIADGRAFPGKALTFPLREGAVTESLRGNKPVAGAAIGPTGNRRPFITVGRRPVISGVRRADDAAALAMRHRLRRMRQRRALGPDLGIHLLTLRHFVVRGENKPAYEGRERSDDDITFNVCHLKASQFLKVTAKL
jgi:hypothetical protein